MVINIKIIQVLEKTDGVETVSVGGHVRGVGGHNKSIHGMLLERFGVLPLLQLNRIKWDIRTWCNKLKSKTVKVSKLSLPKLCNKTI